MGASENPLRQAKVPKKPQVVADSTIEEQTEEAAAAKAARKAAKQARKAALAAEVATVAEEVAVDDEAAAAAAKAARKAAKREAKKVAAEAPDASLEATSEAADQPSDEAAAKAARKAERKAAKRALAEAEAAELEAAEAAAKAKAERKAAKAAKRQAELAQVEAEDGADVTGKKRKACETLPVEGKEHADSKQRKLDDGSKVATNALGAEAFRKAHEIVVAANSPAPMETFEVAAPELGAALTKALKEQGYSAPTPIQAQGWPIALQGRDMVAVAETGSGKTCGFLLPALARLGERGPAPRPKKLSWYKSEPCRPSILVVAPTRELCQQIHGEALKFAPAVNARAVAVYGGVPKGDQARELRQGVDVLIATPGRLLDFCAGDPKRDISPSIELGNVTYLVLDEADRMLDMGFEPDIRKIVDMCPKTGKPEEAGGATGMLAGSMRQTLFFTATWPKDVQQIAASVSSAAAVQVRIGQGRDGNKLSANNKVKQVVIVMKEEEKLDRLKEIIKNDLHKGETAIVFASQKHICDELTRSLQGPGLGIWCRTIHSGKDQWDRDAALAKFRDLTAGSSNGERGVLVATDVASRGLDIPGVALVVVYDFGRALHSGQNGGVESYVHRIGRTGRAGKTGRAFTFFTSEDAGAAELIELLQGAGQEVPPGLEELSWTEGEERWKKDCKKAFYKKGKGKGKGKGKDKGKGKGKAKGKGGGK